MANGCGRRRRRWRGGYADRHRSRSGNPQGRRDLPRRTGSGGPGPGIGSARRVAGHLLMNDLHDDDRCWRGCLDRSGGRRHGRRRGCRVDRRADRFACKGHDGGAREDRAEPDGATYSPNRGTSKQAQGPITRGRVEAPVHQCPIGSGVGDGSGVLLGSGVLCGAGVPFGRWPEPELFAAASAASLFDSWDLAASRAGAAAGAGMS